MLAAQYLLKQQAKRPLTQCCKVMVNFLKSVHVCNESFFWQGLLLEETSPIDAVNIRSLMSQQYSQYQQNYQPYQSYPSYQQGVMPSGPAAHNYTFQPYQTAAAPSGDSAAAQGASQPGAVAAPAGEAQSYQYYPTAHSHYSQYSYPPQPPAQSQQQPLQPQQVGYYYPQPHPSTFYPRHGQYPGYGQSYKGHMQYVYNTPGSAATSETPVQPAGMRPKITTTMWEDEKTLCYQVAANGVAVVRRADNDMINGTKLLNVAKMTRGRRDGILKAEKTRQVVKIGSMHLKGVWIPFERALAMAQREGIVDLLYPLFVKDIKKVIQQGTPTTQMSKTASVPPYSYYVPQQYGSSEQLNDEKKAKPAESGYEKPKAKSDYFYGYKSQPSGGMHYSNSYANYNSQAYMPQVASTQPPADPNASQGSLASTSTPSSSVGYVNSAPAQKSSASDHSESYIKKSSESN
ncbi:hypothetical protein KL944_002616 [Ogataea haglerorum]|nr:hypothetical protein KL944_002616 [Ogataea haglerorum]